MPERTRVPCGWPGCAQLVAPNSGHCDAHKKMRWAKQNYARRSDPTEAQLDRFYSGSTWQRARLMYIREHPLCATCGDVARVVDHVAPRRQGGADLDPANFQSMCTRCHALKSAQDKKNHP